MQDTKPIIRQGEKTERLSLRCTDEFKRIVGKAAIDHDTTIENLCVSLIAQGLGFEIEATDSQAPNAA